MHFTMFLVLCVFFLRTHLLLWCRHQRMVILVIHLGECVGSLPLLLSTVCFCETPNALHHADYHSMWDRICLCACLF